MKSNSIIYFLICISACIISCKKDDPAPPDQIKPTIYLSENAKLFFPYNNQEELTFSDSLGNLIHFTPVSSPQTLIENSHEIKYLNFSNSINDLKILYELDAWENNLHFLTIGFYTEPQPHVIDEIATFSIYTDTLMNYCAFNNYDTTYNQHYDSLSLNSTKYFNVHKLWGPGRVLIKSVSFNRDIGVVGYRDKTNKLWNLKELK